MPQKPWEEFLKKGVVTVGNALERAIVRAEKLKENFRGSSLSAQPLLSLEGQISIPKLKDIISHVSEKLIASAIPPLVDKTALEIREGASVFAKMFREKGASFSGHVDIGGSAGTYGKAEEGVSSLRSVANKLPFEDGFFDYVVSVYANPYQGDLIKAVKELSRVLTFSGEAVVVDFHPFGLYAKRGSLRLKPLESTVRGVEDYYKICKSASLKVTAVRESFLDETVRPLLAAEDEKAAFRMVKDTPLLIYLFVKKG